jgi:hypothetical protein
VPHCWDGYNAALAAVNGDIVNRIGRAPKDHPLSASVGWKDEVITVIGRNPGWVRLPWGGRIDAIAWPIVLDVDLQTAKHFSKLDCLGFPVPNPIFLGAPDLCFRIDALWF